VPVILALGLAFVACSNGSEGPRAVSDDAAGDANPIATVEPLAGGAPPATDPPDPAELLPDLQPMATRELYIEGEGDARVLRFSTTVLNDGQGPLELVGEHRPDEGIIVASQRTLLRDGSFIQREVGRFVFHPEHAHWHFQDFTLLELWTLGVDGEPGDLALSTGKSTFCAVDEVPEAPDASEPAYFTCGDGVQGISAGWSDTYGAEIAGQELPLGALPDGEYVLKSVVDPVNRLAEADEDNNALTERVRIAGAGIAVIE